MAINARSWPLGMCSSEPCTLDNVQRLAREGYILDIKWDGIRALVHIDEDGVQIINRRGVDITFRYPELVESFGALNGVAFPVTFDGEIVVPDPDTGTPMFKWAHQRDAFGPGRARDIQRWATSHPATFMAFDLLQWVRDLRKVSLSERLALLKSILADASNPRFQQSIMSSDATAMFFTVREAKLEGLVAKKSNAPYPRGRGKSWIKLKPVKTVSAIVTGYTAGTGWRQEYFGALSLAVYDDGTGKLIDIGEVGTGFNRDDLNLLDPIVKSGQKFVVEVQYQERQPDTGKLRFPSFKGVRWDVAPSEANAEQFEREPA